MREDKCYECLAIGDERNNTILTSSVRKMSVFGKACIAGLISGLPLPAEEVDSLPAYTVAGKARKNYRNSILIPL